MLRSEDVPAHRTLAFLFTDIEDSTGLWQREAGRMREAMVAHDVCLRGAVEARGGEVFKTVGDAFCVAFESVADALLGAADAQLALRSAAFPFPMRVRMAVHVCEVEPLEGDYRGLGLSRVARLLGLSNGEQVLVSDGAATLARDRLSAPLSLVERGECRLRSFENAERVWQLCHPELPVAFPPLKSGLTTPHNLPNQLTEFIGRERELTEVCRLLATSALVTLTGAGGSGKTRLSLETADVLLPQFPDGVWFVDLSPRAAGEPLFGAVAATIGLRPEPGADIAKQVSDYLSERRVLLVLDNCEHLVAEAATLAETLLTTCRSLRILATSREALEVYGEIAWPVPTLSLPGEAKRLGPKRLLTYESIRLFADRAVAVQPTFRVTGENAPHVAEICRRLDGIPLALIIAASWASVLTPQQIAARIQDRFKLLKQGSSRTAPPRQQTLRAVVDWSFQLCSEAEQALLRRLAVFSGGWDLAAAEAVCEDGIVDDVLESLYSLVRKSLVLAEPGASGERRFRLLETIRQFARDLLDASDESQALTARHRNHYLALAEEAAPHLTSTDAKKWLAALETEHDNLRAALQTSEGDEACRFVKALYAFWRAGHVAEGCRWSELVVRATTGYSPERAAAVNVAGILAMTVGDLVHAKEWFTEACDAFKSLGNDRGVAVACANLGIIASREDRFDEARELMEASLGSFEATNEESSVAAVLTNLSGIASRQGDTEGARGYLNRSLQLQDRLGNDVARADVLHNLAETYLNDHDYEKSGLLFHKCLRIRIKASDLASMLPTLCKLIEVALEQNDPNQAIQLFWAAERCQEEVELSAWNSTNQKVLEQVRTFRYVETHRLFWDHCSGQSLQQLLTEVTTIEEIL